MPREIIICCRCKRREVEMFDDGWHSGMCGYCNDRSAESYRERQEWAHYHPADTADPSPDAK